MPNDFWLDADYRLRPLSQLRLRGCLERYLSWLKGRGLCWWHATPDVLRDYLLELVNRGLADATLRLYRWTLMEFYRWARMDGRVINNPAEHLASMVRRSSPPRWTPSQAQVEHLLAVPDTNTPLGVRDRCVLEMLYATGLRAAELLSLEPHQVNCFAPGVLRVMGKGERERLMVFGEIARDWLERYQREARPALIAQGGRGKSTHKLFVHPVPTLEMTYTHLLRMVRGHARRAGLPMLTPHGLRHAFATHCHANGMHLIALRDMLGHACVSTTALYVHLDKARLRDFWERHHPHGSLYQPIRHGQRQPREPQEPPPENGDLGG